MGYKYFPILQTRDAQLDAVGNLSQDILLQILPIFELTASKRSFKANPNGNVENNIERIVNIMDGQPFILDITTYPILSNIQIDNFFNQFNGFEVWVDFIKAIKNTYSGNVIPCVVFNPYCIDEVQQQIEKLLEFCPYIAFRFAHLPQDKEKDETEFLTKFMSIISDKYKDKILLICDLKLLDTDNICLEFLNTYKDIKTVIVGSSFPKQFNKEDKTIFEFMWDIKRSSHIYYGDYASVHPILYDDKVFNWRARIDFITDKGYIYYRSPIAPSSGETSHQYISIAKQVKNDNRYIQLDCWGSDQIEDASQGNPLKASPSFWITVRINMYITFMIKTKTDILPEMSDLDI